MKNKKFMEDFIEISLIWIANIFFGCVVCALLYTGIAMISLFPNGWNTFTATIYGIICANIYRQICDRNEKRK